MHGGYPPGIIERHPKKMGAISKTECLHRGKKIHWETCPLITPNCFWSSSLWTFQALGEISGCVLEGTLLKPITKVKWFRICFQILANVGLFSQNEKSFTWIKIGFPSSKFGKIWGCGIELHVAIYRLFKLQNVIQIICMVHWAHSLGVLCMCVIVLLVSWGWMLFPICSHND
jgi:hypothetical protein